MDGKAWPGYKLVAGRSVRKYSSEAEIIKAATDAGFTDIYKTVLLASAILKAHGQEEIQRCAGQVHREAPRRADARAGERFPQTHMLTRLAISRNAYRVFAAHKTDQVVYCDRNRRILYV